MLQMLAHVFTRITTWIADAAGQPAAFTLALDTVVVWAVTGPVFAFSKSHNVLTAATSADNDASYL